MGVELKIGINFPNAESILHNLTPDMNEAMTKITESVILGISLDEAEDYFTVVMYDLVGDVCDDYFNEAVSFICDGLEGQPLAYIRKILHVNQGLKLIAFKVTSPDSVELIWR